jgi:hypothetical protein
MAVQRYCSVQDVRNFYRGITPDIYNDQAISSAISLVEAEINTRLKQRYNVPFVTSIPEVIKLIAIDLTAARIIDPMHSGDALSREAPLSERTRKRAIDLLDGLASGKYLLECGQHSVQSAGKI